MINGLFGSDFTDYYFVAHDQMKDCLIYKGIDKSKIFATGIPLSNRFLKKYDRNQVLKSFDLKDDKKTVLFFGGGEFGLGKSKTVEIFQNFVKYASINPIQIIGIAGKNVKMKEAFNEVVKEFNSEENVKILEFTNQVPELMSISDLVVTKPGGMTTTESLASRLPMIVINPIPGQEEENAEFLESKHIAIWIKKHDNSYKIIENLFSHPDILEEMKMNTSILAKPHSTQNICEILLK